MITIITPNHPICNTLILAKISSDTENSEMRFEEIPVEENKGTYLLTFEIDELDIVAAAFREHVYHTVVTNPGSVEGFDMKVSEWEGGVEPRRVRVHQFEHVLEMLDDFSERTRDAMSEIPDISGIPPFQNDAIPERYDLGAQAKILAEHAREVIRRYYEPTESEIAEATEDIEEGLKGILAKEDPR